MTHLAAFSASGWGDDRDFDFHIDFSFYVLHANGSTTTRPIVAWPSGSDYYSPDCDAPGAPFPVPAGGGIEGTSPPAYACDAENEDCHLLVVNDASKILYEAYLADSADSSGVHAICGLRWDLAKTYPRHGRGEHCTSADGAGFPIAPLLFNADEVWTAAQAHGDLGHAIRFILGNNRMLRIVLFVLTNLAVMALLTIVVKLTGLDVYAYRRGGLNLQGLLIMAAVMGMGGSFISGPS